MRQNPINQELEGEATREPDDNHMYYRILFYRETIDFFRASLSFYSNFLEEELKIIQNSAFSFLVSEENQGSLLAHERYKVSRLIEYLNSIIKEDDVLGYDLSFSHGTIRFIKGISLLYINHLKNQRNSISKTRNLSLGVLMPIDKYIAKCEERVSTGVFKNATPLALLVEQVVEDEKENGEHSERIEINSLSRVETPRPVILDSIPIFDTELKSRCLDILEMVCEKGETGRFDTIVQEATKILEIRLRYLSNAGDSYSGKELVNFALGKDAKLILSRTAHEQIDWHLLFMGFFGSLRNSTHHRFVPFQNMERTLQILGMIDFLLHALESAERV